MWMFGSRTTVKKVRNSLTWFSKKAESKRTEHCHPHKHASKLIAEGWIVLSADQSVKTRVLE